MILSFVVFFHTECGKSFEGEELLFYFPNIGSSMELYLFSSERDWIWSYVDAPLQNEEIGKKYIRYNRAEIVPISEDYKVRMCFLE